MPKLCEFENCRKQASYGYFYQTPERCKQHKEDRKPQYSICRCGKHEPNFGLLNDKRASYCSKCKLTNMIDLRHSKCKCGKQPSYGYKKDMKRIACKNCKTSEMIDIQNKNKKKCKCQKKYPSFGFANDKIPFYCNDCKLPNMINIISRRCICGKIPNFALPNSKTAICCIDCKIDEMIDIKNTKCKCGIRACFGYKNDTKALYCNKCKLKGMENIKDKRCKNCADWPDFQQANKKYKNYCVRCFQRLFPTDPLTFQIRCKTKEIAVRDYINTIFDGFQHDKCLFAGGCNCPHRRRIDHRKLIGNTLLCIETDEKQHKRYDKQDENDRYEDLYMVFSGKWIFIRFNPDKYTNKKGVRKNPTIAKRLVKLKEEMEKQIKRIENEENKELVEISYLYYDE